MFQWGVHGRRTMGQPCGRRGVHQQEMRILWLMVHLFSSLAGPYYASKTMSGGQASAGTVRAHMSTLAYRWRSIINSYKRGLQLSWESTGSSSSMSYHEAYPVSAPLNTLFRWFQTPPLREHSIRQRRRVRGSRKDYQPTLAAGWIPHTRSPFAASALTVAVRLTVT